MHNGQTETETYQDRQTETETYQDRQTETYQDRHRDISRQTDRDRDISRQTDRDRDISRQTDRDRDISRQTQRHIKTDRQRQRHIKTDRQRQRHIKTDRQRHIKTDRQRQRHIIDRSCHQYKYLLQQTCVCRDKRFGVCSKRCRTHVCCDKSFVKTKNYTCGSSRQWQRQTDRQTDRQTETDKETEGLVNWHLVDVFLGKACITAYHCSEWVWSLHCCQTWEPVHHPTLLSRQWSMRSTDWALKPNQPVRSDPKLCPQVWKQVGASPEGVGGSKT